MIYLALSLVIFGYLGTVLIAWQSIPKRNLLTYLALLLVLLGAVGAIWITVDSSRTSDIVVEKSDTISQLSLKLYSSSSMISKSQTQLRIKADEQVKLQQRLIEKSEAIARLYKKMALDQVKLQNKSDEISELNKILSGQVTGGDFNGHLVIYRPNANNAVDIKFSNRGKYPLHNVILYIQDYNYIEELFSNDQPITNFNFFKRKAVWVGSLKPSSATFHELVVPNVDKRSYYISAEALNGRILIFVTFRRINDKWAMAQRELDSAGTSKESVDADFPRDAFGNVDW